MPLISYHCFFQNWILLYYFRRLFLWLWGSLGNRWTILAPVRKLELQFCFMAWYPLITPLCSLNIFNHVCVCAYMCVNEWMCSFIHSSTHPFILRRWRWSPDACWECAPNHCHQLVLPLLTPKGCYCYVLLNLTKPHHLCVGKGLVLRDLKRVDNSG